MANPNTAAERTGAAVAAALVTAGKSKSWVAERTGIPYSTLGRKIIGGTEFTISELLTIAEVLGVSPASLLPSDIRAALTPAVA